MKMDFFYGCSVDFGFCCGDPLVDSQSVFFYVIGDREVPDDRLDLSHPVVVVFVAVSRVIMMVMFVRVYVVMVVVLMMLVLVPFLFPVCVDVDMGPGDPALLLLVGVDVCLRDLQFQ